MKKGIFILLLVCVTIFCSACVSGNQNNNGSTECAHSKTKIIEGKDATCTENGISDGEQCLSCGEIIKEQVEIKAMGHIFDGESDKVCNLCGFLNSEIPCIQISETKANVGEKNIKVTVAVKNNPGISSLVLSLSFDDSVLNLTSVVYNDETGGKTVVPQENESPVTLYWVNALSETKGDWTFATLYFDVSETAEMKDYEITVNYDPNNIYNLAESNIYFYPVNGKIAIK